MKISWNHLQGFFSETLDKNLVLERLTMAGLEVEDDQPVAPEFSGIVIGLVTECIKHPDADKLSLCKVDVGTGEALQIICGASNVAVGVKIPCAKVGAVLPGNFKITERKMRGIFSYGMLCSGDELGCPNDIDGLLLLPEDAPIGVDVREYLDLNDRIVEFKITPNRGDCLSYTGLAREISALTGFKLKESTDSINYLQQISSNLAVTVDAPQDCSHYVGLIVNNINNSQASPFWLIKLLERSGVRTISPVVDITNYVMLHLGQPMHAFDLNAVQAGITVHMANVGEQLKLLDGKVANLAPNTLVISDAQGGPLAIAGVMGGLDSGVQTNTTSLVLESAFFAPATVQGKAKQYGVSSDSAFRFERGIDPQLQHDAINLAAQLLVEICGGMPADYLHFSAPQATNQTLAIELNFNEIDNLIGEKIAHEQIISILRDLGCQLTLMADGFIVTPPSYRFDLNIKQDFIEEIIRVYGYDKIEAKMPKLTYTLNSLDERQIQFNNFKQTLLGHGFNEIVSYAFIEDKYADLFANQQIKMVKLQNPIAGLNVLRNNLLPGLIKSLQYNLNRGYDHARLFELARVFHSEDANQQPLHLAGLIYGKISALNWTPTAQQVDFYDLRLVVEELLAGYVGLTLVKSDTTHELCHPGRSALVQIGELVIGFIGQLHPKFASEINGVDLPYVFEINLDLLPSSNSFKLKASSKFQKVSRDLAFVLNKNVQVGTLMQQIKQLQIVELIDLAVFDIFVGGNLAVDEKSVAFNFVFQAEKTLGDEEINLWLNSIKSLVCDKFAAKLR